MNTRNNFVSEREIVVIDPSLFLPEVASFNRLQKMSKLPLTYHLPAFQTENSYSQTPQNQIAGVIIFGSAASVNESRGWQHELVTWIEKMLFPAKIPIFGVCYGHQLLHFILGGKINYVQSNQEKIEGKRFVNLKSNAELTLDSLGGQIVFSHCEHVTQSGVGFENWAEHEKIYHEASFHPGLQIWTMQPHPEATQAFYKNREIEYQRHDSTFGWSILDAFLNKCQS